MFCIAVFIVFGILAIFSASFRPLAAKAWHCTLRRITLRPCDITFGEEIKGKLIGSLVFTHPRLARFLNRWIEWLSFLFVALSIWSLLYVLNAGLNLWVYDTCDPRSGESCSLSGEACSVDSTSLGLFDAIAEDKIGEWVSAPFLQFAETVSRIPDRIKTWDASLYIAPSATYYHPFDSTKPVTLEIIDPGCQFCKKMTHNLRESGVLDATNVTYLLYPIPLSGTGGYKFAHSYRIASVLEAAKRFPLQSPDGRTGDWLLLEKIFAPSQAGETDLQTRINIGLDNEGVEKLMISLLQEIGYSPEEAQNILSFASSEEVQSSLSEQKSIVEQRVRTIKIPTLLLAGRRYDRVVAPTKLKRVIEDL